MIHAALALAAVAGTPDITLEFLGRTSSGGYDVSAAEVVAYDPATQRAFVVNALANAVDLVDISVPAAPVRIASISLLPFGGGLQSVAVSNGLVALAVEATPKTDPGKVVFMSTSGTIITAVTVGALPDHFCFTPDGTRLVGDAREWGSFTDGTPVSTLNVVLDPQVFPGQAWLKGNARLGRLQVRKDLGDLDGDGDYDRLVAFGARSFSIWNAQGVLVWDSADQLEQLTAARFPANFNCSNTNNSRDNRSPQKGPEPEGVTVGVVAGRQFMFGCLERVGGVIAWNIEDPSAPVFQDYINPRDFTQLPFQGNAGDLGSEGLAFVRAENSPNGKPLLLVANEVSGTLSVLQVNATCSAAGDLDGDCAIDGNDLAVLLGSWGSCPAGKACQADLDGNGVVDGGDLAQMLGSWGQ